MHSVQENISNSVSVFNAFCAGKLLKQSLENKNIPFKCILCGKIFKTRAFSTIINYLVQCSDNRTCNVCGKSFDKLETFKVSLVKLNVFYVN